MATKTFKTTFDIAAKFTGQPAFSKANAALTKTGNIAQRTSLRIRGMYRSMTGALATYGVGSRALGAVERGFLKSIEAASEALGRLGSG